MRQAVRPRGAAGPAGLGWDRLAAVRAGRVYALDSEVLQAGPMLMDSLYAMHAHIAAWAREAAR